MRSLTRAMPLRLFVLLIAVCAINVPSLGLGWFGDDYAHRRFILDHLEGKPSRIAWWNMFDWRGTSQLAAVEPGNLFGRLPWWAADDFSFALLRPLGTVSHFLDFMLWPNSAWAMHLHNLALLCVVIWLASRLYLQIFGPGLAAWCAIALFAFDDAHTVSTAWIASRNTLLTALFVLLTVRLHWRTAADGAIRGSRWAWGTLLCAHASSEGAIVAWAYLAGHTLTLDPRPLGARIRALAPLALVTGAWLVLSSALGYGVRGSGVYIDPRYEPWLFLRTLPHRIVELLQLQFGLPREYMSEQSSSALANIASSGYVAALALLAVLYAPRSSSVRFFAFASAASLLPQCAAGSFARLLLLSGFAAHGLIATLLNGLWQSARENTAVRIAFGALALATGFVHGFVAVQIPPRARAFAGSVHASVLRAADSLPHSAASATERIVVLNFPDYLRSVFVDLYRRELFDPGPQRFDVLGIGAMPVKLARPASDALELEMSGGFLFEPTSLLVRRADHRFIAGRQFDLSDLQVEVTQITPDARPARIRVVGIERASTARFVRWSAAERRFVRINLPAPGASDWLDSGAFDAPRP